jgi:HAD superfamily hydrolase (TIGR01509 family)
MGDVIKALLFDFDGTLVDSESVCLRAWEETYRLHGVELSFERWQHGIGTIDGFDELAHLEELLGSPIDRDAVNEEHRVRELEMMSQEPLRPGVAEYLEEASRLGLEVAIVSSSSRMWIETSLGPLARMDGWACITCAEGDAERAKPRPTLYLEALDSVGVSAQEAIAFEDSPNGVTAARAAGIFCVAVPNSVTARLDVSHADLVVGSLEEVPLQRLLERVDERAA